MEISFLQLPLHSSVLHIPRISSFPYFSINHPFLQRALLFEYFCLHPTLRLHISQIVKNVVISLVQQTVFKASIALLPLFINFLIAFSNIWSFPFMTSFWRDRFFLLTELIRGIYICFMMSLDGWWFPFIVTQIFLLFHYYHTHTMIS